MPLFCFIMPSPNTNNFLKSIGDRFKNTSYDSLLKSNPYLTYDYTPGLWDKIGNFFGFNTGEDRLRVQYDQSAREYAAQVAQLAQENTYNSPAEQAARMRAAGQNPDLLGTSGVSSAAEFSQEQTSPDVNGALTQDAENFRNFGSMLLNCVTGGFALAEKFQNLRGMVQSVQGQNLDNFAKVLGISDDINAFLRNTNSFSSPRIDEFGSLNSYSKIGSDDDSMISPVVQTSYGNAPLSKRNRKALNSALSLTFGSAHNLSKYYGDKNSAHKSLTDYVLRSSSSFNSPDIQSEEVLRAVIGPLVEYNDAILKAEKRALKAEGENRADVAENIDSSLVSGASNKENSARISNAEKNIEYNENFDAEAAAVADTDVKAQEGQNARMQMDLNSAKEKVLDKLSKLAEDGNIYAAGVLLTLSSLNGISSVGNAISPFTKFGKSPINIFKP